MGSLIKTVEGVILNNAVQVGGKHYTGRVGTEDGLSAEILAEIVDNGLGVKENQIALDREAAKKSELSLTAEIEELKKSLAVRSQTIAELETLNSSLMAKNKELETLNTTLKNQK